MTKTALRKYFSCLAIALIVSVGCILAGLDHEFSFVLGWDSFGITYLIFTLYLFSSYNHNQIRQQCAQEDVSSWVLFGLVIAACLTGLLVVLTFMDHTAQWQSGSLLGSICCIIAIAMAWMMVHASFAIRYAHLFYGDGNKHFSQHAKGLIFPEDNHPDYFDFAYFSFVIGMTFQVSDVVITSKGVRRLVLLHSIISFVFNTVIIAMTVSQVVGFGGH